MRSGGNIPKKAPSAKEHKTRTLWIVLYFFLSQSGDLHQ
jgi:hypothetical protein